MGILIIQACDNDVPEDYSYLWSMEAEEEIASFGNDGTGAEFNLSSEVSLTGDRAVKVTPSGTSDQTNLDVLLHGDLLEEWIGASQMIINVYRPEQNTLNPTNFYLGMADETDGWNWLDGIDWDEHDLKAGWNEVAFTLPESMSELNPEGEYRIYIMFETFLPPVEDDVKMPLYEEFFIDGIRVNGEV